MTGILFILSLLSLIALVLSRAMRPVASQDSEFELERRSQKNDQAAFRALSREKQLHDIVSLLIIDTAVLLVITTCLFIVTFGWLWGTVLAILAAFFHGTLARIPFVRRAATWLYREMEPSLDRFLARFRMFAHVVRSDAQHVEIPERTIGSREELAHFIEKAKNIVSEDERTTLTSVLRFGGRQVREVMTPRNVISVIEQTEFIGPLVLNELHTRGFHRLPVIDGDLNHVVGILNLGDLLSLDNKKSATAKEIMEPRVYYIHESDTLEHALAAFLKTRHHLFIVINDQRETVGLLSLEDVIETLIGREIVDEDDNHADLRAVAEQQGRNNNRPPRHVDL